MKRLTAQRPILYGGRMYQAGDTLPAYDKRMVQAWLSAESAKMTDDAAEEATMPPQDADGGQDGTENADTTKGTQEVTDATEGTQESQESQENHDGNHSGESTDMVEGHLDPARLEEMNKDDLKKLAKDMGVDLPRGAAKALIVERLAAAIVQTPAAAIVPPAADNGGGAQLGAPTFKEQIAADISTTFLNCLEFADTHTVNGKEMAAVVDDNELLERDKAKIMAAQTEGTYKARRLVYVAKADFGPRPAQGAMLTLDGKAYKVKSCTEEAGVLAIELEAVRS